MIELKFTPKKNQQFEIGRTINFTRCTKECGQVMGQCDFIHCPIENYAPIMKRYIYSVKEFYNITKDREGYYNKNGMLCSKEAIGDFLDACIRFPRANYWNLEESIWGRGYELSLGKVAPRACQKYFGQDFTWGARIFIQFSADYVLYSKATQTQDRLAAKIVTKLKQLQKIACSSRETGANK